MHKGPFFLIWAVDTARVLYYIDLVKKYGYLQGGVRFPTGGIVRERYA